MDVVTASARSSVTRPADRAPARAIPAGIDHRVQRPARAPLLPNDFPQHCERLLEYLGAGEREVARDLTQDLFLEVRLEGYFNCATTAAGE